MPLVLEAGAVVGGRTASWVEDGMPVESGLHRFFGFYGALIELLKQVGVHKDDIIAWEDEMEIRMPDGGPSAVFGMSPLHKPLRTLSGLLGNTHLLPWMDKARLLRAFSAGLWDFTTRPLALDTRSILEYAEARGVHPELITRVLVPLTAGVFFLPPNRYSAHAFFTLLALAARYWPRLRLGAFKGGMTETMAEPIARGIERLGGDVRTQAPVTRLLVQQGRVVGVTVGDTEMRARHVVVATGVAEAQRLLRPAFARHPWFAPLLDLPTMPSVTFQAELDGPSMSVDRTTFGPDTALASFSEQSRTTFRHAAGRLSVILGPPERFLSMPPERILEQVCADADRLHLRVRGHVLRYRVIRHPAEFASLAPGHYAQRPPQRTPIRGLTLAGDYTKQPFLLTMEGAVRSGYRAAAAVVADS